MRGGFMAGVTASFELKRGVVDVEVARQAPL
jgi:hypothetical protein